MRSAPVERNDELWADHPVGPPAGSPLRTRCFWWEHYLLAEQGEDHDLPPAPDRRPWDTSIILREQTELSVMTGLDLSLVFRTGDDGSSLELRGYAQRGSGTLARLARLRDLFQNRVRVATNGADGLVGRGFDPDGRVLDTAREARRARQRCATGPFRIQLHAHARASLACSST